MEESTRLLQLLSGAEDGSGSGFEKRAMLFVCVQTNLDVLEVSKIKDKIWLKRREKGYATKVIHVLSAAKKQLLEKTNSSTIHYAELTSRLLNSWNIDTQEATHFMGRPGSGHDMVFLLDHDEHWSLEFAAMAALLTRRLDLIAKSRNRSTFVRVALLSTAPMMDSRLQDLFFASRTPYNWALPHPKPLNMMEKDGWDDSKRPIHVEVGKLVGHLTSQINKSPIKEHIILCFPPWDRVQALRNKPQGVKSGVYFEVYSWEQEGEFGEVSRLRLQEEFLEDALCESREGGPETVGARKRVLLILLESASDIIWPSMIPKDHAVWVVLGQKLKQATLEASFGRVVFDVEGPCHGQERAMQMVLAQQTDPIATDEASVTITAQNDVKRRLGIENERLADFICFLAYLSGLDEDFDMWRILHGVVRRPALVAEMIRRLGHQGCITYLPQSVRTYLPQSVRLVSAIKPCQALYWDHRLSRLLDAKPARNRDYLRVEMTKVMLATVLKIHRNTIMSEEEVRKAMALVGPQPFATRIGQSCGLFAELATEGTPWLAAGLASLLIPWKVPGGEEDRENAFSHAEAHPDTVCRVKIDLQRSGKPPVSVHVRVDEFSLEPIHETIMTLVKEPNVHVTPEDVERLMTSGAINGIRLVPSDKEELYQQLLDSFLFDLVCTKIEEIEEIKEPDDAVVSVETRMHINNQILEASALIKRLMYVAWRKEQVTSRAEGKQGIVVLGICPSITMRDGKPAMMDWIWVPMRSAIRWHHERHPGKDILVDVWNGGRLGVAT